MDWIADTSVAVPALVLGHDAHAAVVIALDGRSPRLAAHAALETYSVLTRLPGDARLAPDDAAQLISARFGEPLALPTRIARSLNAQLARQGIAGGAVYDAAIAVTAKSASATLLTRDARAIATYARLGVSYEIVG